VGGGGGPPRSKKSPKGVCVKNSCGRGGIGRLHRHSKTLRDKYSPKKEALTRVKQRGGKLKGNECGQQHFTDTLTNYDQLDYARGGGGKGRLGGEKGA